MYVVYLFNFKLMLTTLDDPDFEHQQLAWQFGSTVIRIQPGLVLKKGAKVRPSEERAMRLVKKYIPELPVPSIHSIMYKFEHGIPFYGELEMDFMPGRTLKSMWAELDERTKGRVCQDIWDLVALIRARVPRPDDLAPGLYRTVDGSPSRDPLLGDNNDVAPSEFDDDMLRNRIYTRYVDHHGLSYRDGKDVLDLLPRSSTSVFTHGDLAPRNIIVDDQCRITGVLDWESSGWFPDYWEYAQMMKWCDTPEQEWKKWMAKTKPRPWDITGIQKARRVLF
jgi:hypothetical protein